MPQATLRVSGELDVIVNGNPVHRIRPGEIIGEMIVWFGGVRQATLKAASSGVIATLLMGAPPQQDPLPCTRLLSASLPARGCPHPPPNAPQVSFKRCRTNTRQ